MKRKILIILISVIGVSLFVVNSVWTCQDSKKWGSNEICSILGDKKKHYSLDIDGYTFLGQRGEKVIIELKPDLKGVHSGEEASLILAAKSKPFFTIDRNALPNQISTSLPYTGKYLVMVVEQQKFNRFTGNYCISLRSSRNAWKSFKPFSLPNGSKYPIYWYPKRIEEFISAGMAKELKAVFVSRIDLKEANLWVVPELRPFVKVEPDFFERIEANVPYEITIHLTVPSKVTLGNYNGTIHLRHHRRTYPQTLKVDLNVVENVSPVADAGLDQVITLGPGQNSVEFYLDGSNSYDPDGWIVSYTWSGTPDPADTVNPKVILTPGEYTFYLVVTDNQGISSEPDAVVVKVLSSPNQTPIANAGQNQTIQMQPGQTVVNVQLDGSGSFDVDGTIVSYLWTGNPDPSDVVNPIVSLAPGTYNFTLTVTDDSGASSTPSTVTITVLPPPNQRPVANSGENQTIILQPGQVFAAVQLSGSGSYDPDGSITNYIWTGNPDPGDVVNPVVILSPGTYLFTLLVTDDKGATSDPSSVTITVLPPPNQSPVANAGPNQTITLSPGQNLVNVQLDGSGSTDPDGTIVSYTWTGNPDPADVVKPTVSLGAGTYTFALLVTDDKGATSPPSTVTITILPPANQPPIAHAGLNQTVSLQIGQTSAVVQLDGSGSYDPDGVIAKYIWTGIPDPSDEEKPLLTLKPGTYNFILTVWDDQNAKSAPSSVTINVLPPPNQPPVVNAGVNQVITFPSSASLNGTVTDDGWPMGSSLAISWSKVSGPGIVTFANPNSPATTANFSQSGTYVLRLTASDSDLTSSSEVTIIVNQPPVANAGKNQYLTLPPGQSSIEVQLDGSGSTDTDGSIVSYIWSGNPTPAAEPKPKVTLGVGIYAFSLVVMDNLGASSVPSVVNVQVEKAAAPPQLLVSPLEYTVNQGATLTVNVSGQSPEGRVVSLSAEPALSNATFTTTSGNPATGVFSFSPQAGQVGIYMVSLKARDTLGLMDRKTIQINVKKVNRAPVLTAPDTAIVDEGKILTIPISAIDPDGDKVTLSAIGLPNNAIFIPATGTITFAPNYEQAGVYTVTVSASDGELSTSKNIQITVNDVPTAPRELVLQVDPVESPTFLSTLKITGMVNPTGEPPSAPKIKSALITGMSPTTGEQGQTLTVTLTGQSSGDYMTHFTKGVSQANFGPGITVNSVNVISSSQINASITISTTAAEGARAVSVTTGGETAVSVLAFNVTRGKAKISGRLIDPDSGQAISGAIISVQGTNIKTTTDANGYFSFLDVPAGKQTLIVNAQNYELLNIPLEAQVGTTFDVGTVKSRPTVFDPSAPPAVSLVSIAGRNFGNITGGQEIEDIKKVITDSILLVGGSEAGVIDEYGNQLNPQVSGAGLISLKPEGVRLIAQKMERGGETVSLGELLFAFSFGLRWSQGTPLSLDEWINILQGQVNQAWSAQNNPNHYLPILMFNRGKNISPDPPELSAFTRLNPAQAFLFVSSLWAYILSQEEETQNAQRNKNIYLASLFSNPNIVSDAFPRFIMIAQAQPPSPPPTNGSKPFTAFWRNAFASRSNVLTTNYNNAYISYLVMMNSLALPFVWSISESAIGSVVEQMQAVIRSYGIANIIPEPPQANSMSSQVTTDQVGLPTVRIKFKLSPTQINDRNIDRIYVYTLYRYGNGSAERKVVDFKTTSLAKTNGFDLTLKDTEPLPLITDSTGQVVRAPSATWFYTVTVSMLKNGQQEISAQALENATPWWNQPLHKLYTSGETLLSLPQILMSDYSVPLVVNVSGTGEIFAEEIEVDPNTGDIYLSDRIGDITERQPRFIKISEVEGSRTFAYSGFKNPPGHKGLAIDKEGNLYTDNAASDAQFGGRIFKFYQPDGRRDFVGNINYFSQMLMYARPTSAGPMAIGPGTMPEVSEEDLYVVDELEGMVKRVMVNASFDPYRRVGQPFANIPIVGPNADLEVDETGNVYLLKERIPATVLNLSMNVSKTSLELNETFTVTLTVTNPGSETATGVHILPMVLEGLGSVRLVKLPVNPTVDLAPGETATFTFEYLAATTGTVKFAAQVNGTDSGGYTISSPVVRSDAAIEIVRPKPLEVFIQYPEKSKPVIGLQEVLKVELTVQASVFNDGPIEEIRFQGEPLALTPGGKLEVVSRDPQEIPTEFSLKPGESKTFKFDLRGVKWGTTQLSSFVAAVDSKGQTLSASDSIKVTVKANLLKVNLKAEPSGLKLEKDAENKPIPQEVNVTVEVKNIINEPLPVVNIPGKLLLYAVYETSTLQMNCPLTQISPDPIGSDWITSLQPGETKTRSYVFKAEDDGKCDVAVTVTAADPENPDKPFSAGSAERVVVSKDMLSLDIEFEKDMYFLNKGEIGFGGEAMKKNLGEPFLVFGWVRNLSNFQKLYITEIKGEILPGSTLARIAKPVLIDNKEREVDFDGCGCKPKAILDPGEVLMFSIRVMTVDEPLVREKRIPHVDLRFQVIGQAIDPDETRTPVVSNIVERRMPIDYAEKYLTFKEGWYRFTDKALESFCMSFAFPALLWEMLWVKDKDGNNALSKAVYDAFDFGIQWWRDLPYNDRKALVKKFQELGGAMVEETIGKVDKYTDDLYDAIKRRDWGKVADMTGPLAGEFSAEFPGFILTCGAGWAIKKAGKKLATEAVEEVVEAEEKRLLKQTKKLTEEELIHLHPGNLKKLQNGYEMDVFEANWMFGVGQRKAAELKKIAYDYNCKILGRSRAPIAAEKIEKGLAIPKAEEFKQKCVSELDRYLGYSKDNLGTVVFRDKYALKLPGYDDPKDLKILEDILKLGGDKSLEAIKKLPKKDPNLSDEVWSNILDRYATRVKEYDKYAEQLRDWNGKEIELNFRFEPNGVNANPIKKKVEFKLEEFPPGSGDFRIMTRTKADPNWKQMAGDFDIIAVLNADGSPILNEKRRIAIWKALHWGEDGAQHMDSATFENLKIKQGYIDDHSFNKGGIPLLEVAPDKKLRAVHIDDTMNIEYNIPIVDEKGNIIQTTTATRFVVKGGYVPAPPAPGH